MYQGGDIREILVNDEFFVNKRTSVWPIPCMGIMFVVMNIDSIDMFSIRAY